jgi:hypothetical protein
VNITFAFKTIQDPKWINFYIVLSIIKKKNFEKKLEVFSQRVNSIQFYSASVYLLILTISSDSEWVSLLVIAFALHLKFWLLGNLLEQERLLAYWVLRGKN